MPISIRNRRTKIFITLHLNIGLLLARMSEPTSKTIIQKSPRLSFSAERNQGQNDGGTDFLVLLLLLYYSLLECQTYSS
jgi:hypothetical protein